MENLFQFTDKMFGAKCLHFLMYLYKSSLLHVPLALDMVKNTTVANAVTDCLHENEIQDDVCNLIKPLQK